MFITVSISIIIIVILVFAGVKLFKLGGLRIGKRLDIEHGIYCYCGRLGQGKTYTMVKDLVRRLNQGHVVYCNFTINWGGFDQKKSPIALLFGAIGLKKKFVKYPSTNLRKMPTDENWHSEFGKLTNCIVAIDEAYILFDSYQMSKMPMYQRLNILQTRKFDRSIWYTTQRPTNVHVVMRGMTNVFYRCEKWNVPLIPLTLFARDEFDLASDETLDVEKRLSRRLYWGEKRFYKMYNTKETVGMRGQLANNIPGKIVLKTETKEISIVTVKEIWAALAAQIKTTIKL